MSDTPLPEHVSTLAERTPAPVDPMAGAILDKYKVIEQVGVGGMATVYRALHQTLNRQVALKLMHPMLARTEAHRRRFLREAQTYEQLRHPNIPRIFDFSGVEDERCFIVSEFISGVTVSDLLDSLGPLPSEIVAWVGIQVAQALTCAHEQQVVHRDVKPENIMLAADGRVYLMDFGIARLLDESSMTMTGSLVGSPAYMSPEQASEQPVDKRSDLFSLGTVLFRMATGTLPFSGQNTSVVLKNILEGRRPGLRELSPDANPLIASVIERLLEVNKEDRPNDAHEVIDGLTAALGDVELPTDPLTDSPLGLAAFLAHPDATRERLRAHLISVLAKQGQQALEEGRKVRAMGRFDRVLCMDEANTEVLALLQQATRLSGGETRKVPSLALSLLLVTVAFGAYWAYRPERVRHSPMDLSVSTPPLKSELLHAPKPVPTPPAPAVKPHLQRPRPHIAKAEPVPEEPPAETMQTPRPAPTVGVAGPPATLLWASGSIPLDLQIDGTMIGRIDGVRHEHSIPAGYHKVCAVHRKGLAETFCEERSYLPDERSERFLVAKDLEWKPTTLEFDLPPGCKVRIDGTPLGLSPLPPYQHRGLARVRIEIEPPGGSLLVRSFDANPGARIPVRLGS